MALVAVVAAILGVAAPQDLRAAPGVEVRWSGDACATDGLEPALARWRGDAIVSEGVVVDIRVATRPDGALVASIDAVTPWGTSHREAVASRCESIVGAIALLVAITLDPVAIVETIALPEPDAAPPVGPPPTATTEPPPESPPAVVARPSEPEPPPPFDRPAPRLRAALRIDGLVGAGQVPAPSGGVGIALGVEARVWSIAATAAWWPRRDTTPRATGQYAEIQLVTAGVQGCAGLRRGTLVAAACGGLEAGAMLGRGREVLAPARRAIPHVAITLGPELRWQPTARFGLVIGVEGVLVVHRPRFAVEGLGDLYVAPLAAVRSRIGLQLRLP